eukprot:601574-Karenia_brevis.AAC.1
MRWVDTEKGYMRGSYDVRCRMVARDFKGKNKHRDDLSAETPPLEAKRMLMSRAVTRRRDDVKKAHLNPKCEEDVYLELHPECHCPK